MSFSVAADEMVHAEEHLRVFNGPLITIPLVSHRVEKMEWNATYGHNALILIPSLACTIASSRVIAKTPP